jgi:cytochrome P450
MGFEVFSRDWHRDYDCTDPALVAEWNEVAQDLHARCPVAHSTIGTGYWVTTKYDDIRAITKDWQTFTNSQGFVPNSPDGMPEMLPEQCDPPLHDRIREHLNPRMGPKRVALAEPAARRFCHELIDGFGSEIDCVTDFGNLLPMKVYCQEIAGIPVDDGPRLAELLHLGTLGPPEGRLANMLRVQDYFIDLIEQRRKEEPKDDQVNDVITCPGPEYEDQTTWRAAALTGLAFGGIGTTGYAIERSLWYLAEHPEVRARLAADRSLIPRAIEEFLRVYAAAPHGGRVCTRDTEVRGTQMKKGDFVILGFAFGSLDSDLTSEPLEVKLDRFPNPHLAFGTGQHRCIGMHLARMQVRVALEVWLERIPEFSVSDFEPQYDISTSIALHHLPMKIERKLPRQSGAGSATTGRQA